MRSGTAHPGPDPTCGTPTGRASTPRWREWRTRRAAPAAACCPCRSRWPFPTPDRRPRGRGRPPPTPGHRWHRGTRGSPDLAGRPVAAASGVSSRAITSSSVNAFGSARGRLAGSMRTVGSSSARPSATRNRWRPRTAAVLRATELAARPRSSQRLHEPGHEGGGGGPALEEGEVLREVPAVGGDGVAGEPTFARQRGQILFDILVEDGHAQNPSTSDTVPYSRSRLSATAGWTTIPPATLMPERMAPFTVTAPSRPWSASCST